MLGQIGVSPKRLNLGCGTTVVQGWDNIDRSPNLILDRFRPLKRGLYRFGVISAEHMIEWPPGVIRHDVRKGLPYPDGSVDAVYSSHMLEHIYLDEARRLLREAAGVLRIGGIIRLALPDSEVLAKALVESDTENAAEAARQFNLGLRAHPSDRPTGRKRLTAMLGANIHLWQPTPALVSEFLEEAGFHDVFRYDYREGSLPDLHSIEQRPESFFLEAVR